MRRIVSAVLMLAMAIPGRMVAQHRNSASLQPGDRVRVKLVGANGKVEGNVLRNSLDSLAVIQKNGRGNTEFRWRDVRQVEVPTGRSHARGARNGLLAGAVVGAVWGALAASSPCESGISPQGTLEPCLRGFGGAAVITVFGIGVGGAIGAVMGATQWNELPLVPPRAVVTPNDSDARR